ncbi:MAG: DMT family transporter [Alphaproteobacteria bacterium]|nr:DMT family transporter [Alphaproteobacteria bacterium]MBT4016523.1 DMT family transporter [Alphaproteobacteria bacterium]MBT5160058.1 DMT family transporter [Alphaproteobacteria bacterium]MBT6385761.1 DMT family transporter [Alphaproteobacteria bacterium]
MNEKAQNPLSQVGQLPPNLQGALWILSGAILFSVMAVFIKYLGPSLGTPTIAFYRAIFSFLTILPFALSAGLAGLRTNRPVLHLFRGMLGTSAMFCGIFAVTNLALADAVALSFTRPLFLIVLAVLFLGEVVRVRRWAATAVGFAGVMIMVRPDGSNIDAGTMAALLGTMLVAATFVTVKKLSVTERPSLMLFYFGIISIAMTSVPALLDWREPTFDQFLMLVGAGVFGVAGQACVVRGLKIGEATAVMPFDYARIIIAAAIGYWLFGEVPDIWTGVGAAVIIGASLYIAHREATRKKHEDLNNVAQMSEDWSKPA